MQETKKLTGNVMAAIKTMAVVDQANQLGRVLPPEAFYNELIRCRATLLPARALRHADAQHVHIVGSHTGPRWLYEVWLLICFAA